MSEDNQSATPIVKEGVKFRYYFMGLGSLLAILMLFLIDPESKLVTGLPFGAAVIPKLGGLLATIITLAMLHFGRKSLVDYLDLSSIFAKAIETPQGAGLAAVAVGLIYVAVAITILAASTIF